MVALRPYDLRNSDPYKKYVSAVQQDYAAYNPHHASVVQPNQFQDLPSSFWNSNKDLGSLYNQAGGPNQPGLQYGYNPGHVHGMSLGRALLTAAPAIAAFSAPMWGPALFGSLGSMGAGAASSDIAASGAGETLGELGGASGLPWEGASAGFGGGGNIASALGATGAASSSTNPLIMKGLGALASGAFNYSQNHNPLQALGAAGGSFIGGNIASSLLGDSLGTVGSTIGAGSSDIASAFGNGVGGIAGDIAKIPISNILGGVAGSQLGASQFPNSVSAPAGPAPFRANQATPMGAPSSLSNISSLTPDQQASSLATQGVYGGGNGPEEQAYYGNLLNRQLIDNQRNISPLSSLSPIEQSYNSQLGFGGAKDSRNLLEMLSTWKPNA